MKNALKHEGEGEWQKILKRFYRQAARAMSKLFVRRASKDVKEFPGLVDRVADYIRYVSNADEVVMFVEDLLSDAEQVYPDVNYQLIECLLKLFPDKTTAKQICRVGAKILNGELSFPGALEAKVLAPLLVLRYGDKRNVRSLITILERDAEKLSPNMTRALCAVVGGCGTQGFAVVQDTASRLLRNHLSEFVKLVVRIKVFTTVPGRFKSRVALGRDSITGSPFIDMRALLAARILGLCNHKEIHKWLADTKKKLLLSDIMEFDRKLIVKLWPTPSHGK